MANNTSKYRSHVKEIQYRAGYVVFSFLCTCIYTYEKALQLYHIFLSSFTATESTQKTFIFTDVHEAFSSTISICLIASFLLVIPLISYQILCFLLPSWYVYERRKRCIALLTFFSCWCFYMWIVQSLIIPYLCAFLLEFQVHTGCLTITIEARILSYVSWVTNLLLIATVIFVLVSVAVGSIIYKIVSASEWGKHRTVFVLWALIFAASISPPDPWSQVLLAFIFYLFYESLLWIGFVQSKIRYKNN